MFGFELMVDMKQGMKKEEIKMDILFMDTLMEKHMKRQLKNVTGN